MSIRKKEPTTFEKYQKQKNVKMDQTQQRWKQSNIKEIRFDMFAKQKQSSQNSDRLHKEQPYHNFNFTNKKMQQQHHESRTRIHTRGSIHDDDVHLSIDGKSTSIEEVMSKTKSKNLKLH